MSAGEHNHGFGVTAECAQFLDSIVYLIDNELADEDVVAVRLHIDGCTPCHERYEVQRTVKAVVALLVCRKGARGPARAGADVDP